MILANVYRFPGRGKLGEDARDTVISMIRSTTLWPFRQRANPCLTQIQFETLIRGAERELQRDGEDSLKLYLNVYDPCVSTSFFDDVH